jgi:nucleoside-diphosphate-sugar epimerase
VRRSYREAGSGALKLLILGGTVFLSRAIAERGVARGHDVTAAARGKSGAAPAGARFVRIDRDEPASLEPLRSEAFDAVVDVARLPRQVGDVLEALAADAGHWTFVSSCSAYADQSIPGQTAEAALLEPAAPDSADPAVEHYGPSKVACETLVRERVGDRAFVVRPGLVVGAGDPNDRFGYWPTRIAEGGETLAPGSPEEQVQYVDVRDLAAWVVDAAESGVTGTYDAVCPPMSRETFLAAIARAVGSRPMFTWVPGEFLIEQGVRPWAGEESLGLWLPVPEYAGLMARDPTASLEAGLRCRPLGETARDWLAARDDSSALLASLSREKEAAVLAAWRGRS